MRDRKSALASLTGSNFRLLIPTIAGFLHFDQYLSLIIVASNQEGNKYLENLIRACHIGNEIIMIALYVMS
jgi:hypothetical protein